MLGPHRRGRLSGSLSLPSWQPGSGHAAQGFPKRPPPPPSGATLFRYSLIPLHSLTGIIDSFPIDQPGFTDRLKLLGE